MSEMKWKAETKPLFKTVSPRNEDSKTQLFALLAI